MKKYFEKMQGNGVHSIRVEEYDNEGNLINCYMVYPEDLEYKEIMNLDLIKPQNWFTKIFG